jgi:O-succinylbenzoic acid--CoA ligase
VHADHPAPLRRRELHFGNRVVWCFGERMRCIYGALRGAVQQHGDRTALVFGEGSWTYAQVEAEVGRIAAGLRLLGVTAGDRVAMWVRNRPEFVFIFFAIQRLGAVAVPVDVRLQAAEMAHVLADSGARVLLHDEELTGRLPIAGVSAPHVQPVAVPEPKAGALFAHASYHSAPEQQAAAREDDVAVILYTSGTTGRPKGAAITHFNVAHSVLHHAGNLGLTADDRSLIALPLSHVTGLLCGVIAPFSTGGTLILLPNFKAAEFLRTAAAARMTYTIMVPAMYHLCLREADFAALDLSTWRLGHFGGAPMPQATIDALARRLPGLQLVNGYGATELCSPATMWPPGEPRVPLDSVGRVMPCAEIVVVDPETGIEVPSQRAGELWIRGPMVIKEYWNDPAATAAGIVDGYWRSGDLGSIDADGWVYVHDRLKDLINRGGYKVYSAEVEACLLEFPGIAEAAVVAKRDPVLGERVHAFVSASQPVSPCELSAFCAERLADYKVPEGWTIGSDPLPRTHTGKVDKKDLRLRAAACQPLIGASS